MSETTLSNMAANPPEITEVFRKNPTFVSREIAGEIILVPIRHKAGELSCIYTLNETAALTWSLLDGSHSLEQIRDQILAEYEIEPAQAWSDLQQLLLQLQEIGAVERI